MTFSTGICNTHAISVVIYMFQFVTVKSVERNSASMYLARDILLGLKSEAKMAAMRFGKYLNLIH